MNKIKPKPGPRPKTKGLEGKEKKAPEGLTLAEPLDESGLMVKRRPAGRIPSNERVDTKEILYQQAILVISDKGIQGATIKEIARKANLTPAMVHYHFKDKETLIKTTLLKFIKPLSDSVWEAVELDIGPLEMLREFHSRLSKVFKTVPWYRSLWSKELAGVHAGLKSFMGSLIGENRLRLFKEKIEIGQKQGLINPVLAPELIFATLIALIYLPRIGAQHWSNLCQVELDEETVDRHVWASILDGITAKDAGKLK
ncbi:MAG: TetR/AcrR family transcriptional regulator [Deltaproteobacteria bacterium]|jgi:AcrR family transcriptional regulator|nr:TetR/AcrR family transcriptional regulator [Deltaproteobacteria bacterium]